jgi:RNA polymerase sigma-70 factor (ECF subfamily)
MARLVAAVLEEPSPLPPAQLQPSGRRMNDVDSRLVEKARAGDAQAFGLIFERSKGMVWNVAYRMTGDFDAAEDLAQDVFVTAWRKLASFRGDSAFSTWLYRITVNKAFNAKKSGKMVQRLTDEEMANLVDVETFAQQNPSAGVDQMETERVLAGLLAQLEPERRLALILREIEGLSYEEIAEAMDTPVGTVRSRISRAREELEAIAKKMGSLP